MFIVRLNITSVLYDPALEVPGSHMYQQVALKVRNMLFEEILNKIQGTHSVSHIEFR